MFTRFSPQTARYPNRTTFPHTIGHLFCIKKKNKRSPWSGTTRDDSRFSNNNNLLKVGKSLLKFNNFVLLSAAPSSEYLNYQTPTWIHRPSWLSPRECARTSPPACYDQQLTMTEGLSTAKVAAGSSHAKSIPIGKVFFLFCLLFRRVCHNRGLLGFVIFAIGICTLAGGVSRSKVSFHRVEKGQFNGRLFFCSMVGYKLGNVYDYHVLFGVLFWVEVRRYRRKRLKIAHRSHDGHYWMLTRE